MFSLLTINYLSNTTTHSIFKNSLIVSLTLLSPSSLLARSTLSHQSSSYIARYLLRGPRPNALGLAVHVVEPLPLKARLDPLGLLVERYL